MTVTHISAATAAFIWMMIEWFKHGKPTLVGTATGCIAGSNNNSSIRFCWPKWSFYYWNISCNNMLLHGWFC